MKAIIDYRREALNEMANSGTLTRNGLNFYPNDRISVKELQQALITRFSTKLNDALYEPYRKAILRDAQEDQLDEIVDSYKVVFTKEIMQLLKDWGLDDLSESLIKSRLENNLDSKYLR